MSKSGVGKSSFLLKIQSLTEDLGEFSPIIDMREIRSQIDLLKLSQYFVTKFVTKFDRNIKVPSKISESYLQILKIDLKIKRNTICLYSHSSSIFSLTNLNLSKFILRI